VKSFLCCLLFSLPLCAMDSKKINRYISDINKDIIEIKKTKNTLLWSGINPLTYWVSASFVYTFPINAPIVSLFLLWRAKEARKENIYQLDVDIDIKKEYLKNREREYEGSISGGNHDLLKKMKRTLSCVNGFKRK